MREIKVFHMSKRDIWYEAVPGSCWLDDDGEQFSPGWYWWAVLPDCRPDLDPLGPFNFPEEAEDDAQHYYPDAPSIRC